MFSSVWKIETKNFIFERYGNGAAFSLKNLESGKSIHLQGDDAVQFGNELDEIEDNNHHFFYDDILHVIWFSYGYDQVAE